MTKEDKKRVFAALGSLTAFAFWTAAVCLVDVRPIGPNGSYVGFAALNGAVHAFTGVHMVLYTVTDLLSLVPLGVAAGFALLGLVRWIRRKSLREVDRSLMVLGGFYVLVMVAFWLFECCPVNYRPVLIDGALEASYPSSTTLLVLTVMPAAAMQLRRSIEQKAVRRAVTAATAVFAAFMVLARFLSGVHWLTDIVGGILLSAGLVLLYHAAVRHLEG